MEHEVQGARPRGRPKKTWRAIVENRHIEQEDAIDCNR